MTVADSHHHCPLSVISLYWMFRYSFYSRLQVFRFHYSDRYIITFLYFDISIDDCNRTLELLNIRLAR